MFSGSTYGKNVSAKLKGKYSNIYLSAVLYSLGITRTQRDNLEELQKYLG